MSLKKHLATMEINLTPSSASKAAMPGSQLLIGRIGSDVVPIAVRPQLAESTAKPSPRRVATAEPSDHRGAADRFLLQSPRD